MDNKCENIIPNIILNGYSYITYKKIPKHEKQYTKFLFMDTNSVANDSYIEQLVDKKLFKSVSYENF